MPLYHYTAFDGQGRRHQGVVDAFKEREAKEQLRSQGLLVAKLDIKGNKKRLRLNGEALLSFTMQLKQLVEANVPLFEALLAIEQQLKGESYHVVIVGLCEEIRRGQTLSSALAKYPDSFDTLYVSLVAAGEAVGSLASILAKISHLLERRSKLKRELGNALIYPSILALFSLVVIGVLLGFVVPSIEDMFQDRELNGFTNAILFLSHFITDKWWIYLPTLILGGSFAFMKLKSQQGKEWLEKRLMKTPLIKKIVVGAALARFCRTMGTLQEGGLQMAESLKLAKLVLQNRTLELVIKKAENRILEGSQLTVELKRSEWIPPLMVRLLSIGEETGAMGSMFNKLAEIYEGDLEKLLSRTVALAQPVILILMGGFIGLVMIATLLPLTQMASLR